MKKILIEILALAAVFVSCQKAAEMEESVKGAEGRLEVTGRVADGATKTVFTCEGHVLAPVWKLNDRIIGLWGDDKSVTWSVRKVVDGVAKFKYVSGEEPGDGDAVNVIYAPGKSASDISGTGDARTMEYDLSSQPGTLEGLGKVSLMTGSGTVSGESLELTFTHTLAVVSLDTLKGLIPNGSGYSVSIEGTGLANCGTFGISGGAVAFTNGADGRISTGSTFTANAAGEIGPVFFAVPAAGLGVLRAVAAKGADTTRYILSGKAVTAGSYYYKAVADALPPYALPGVFSVSPTKKVYFSQGNLYWNGSAFRFEEHQKDFVNTYDASHRNFFWWMDFNELEQSYADYCPILTEIWPTPESAPSGLFTNAGPATPHPDFVVNGVEGTWRVLAAEEWEFLLNNRNMLNGHQRFMNSLSSPVIVDGQQVKGFFIYPDGFSGPELGDG